MVTIRTLFSEGQQRPMKQLQPMALWVLTVVSPKVPHQYQNPEHQLAQQWEVYRISVRALKAYEPRQCIEGQFGT